MQSKVDTKKLELSDKKCYKMHVGNNSVYCPSLKVNGQEMKNSAEQTYLGDIISNNAKIDENIKLRSDKGMGIANQILSILKEVLLEPTTLKW